MQSPIFFDDVATKDMVCATCGTKIEWGVTTKYCDQHEDHVCCTCGTVVQQ